MKILEVFVSSIGGQIVLFILALDTIRAVVAFTGIIPRSTKFWGRLIYGKYDVDIVASAFQELGYSEEQSQKEYKKLKRHISKMRGTTSVTEENAPVYLVLLLAKYCACFSENVSYGGNTISRSKYYLDTMEMVHDKKDLKIMNDIMVMLFATVDKNKPDVIIGPKGGNPLFAAKIAEYLERPVIFAKGEKEKSKITSHSPKEQYQINYEGSWKLQGRDKKQKGVIVDCNISGGNQIKAIVENLNILQSEVTNIEKVKHVFVLFRADDEHKDVETTFKNLGVSLHRYFDLDEPVKEKIYQIKLDAENEEREISFEYKDDRNKARKIIDDLKTAQKYYYKK